MSSMSRRLSDKRNHRTASIMCLLGYPTGCRLVPLYQNSWIHSHICCLDCLCLQYIHLSTAGEFLIGLRHVLGNFTAMFGLSKYIWSQRLPLLSTLTNSAAPQALLRDLFVSPEE